MEGASVGSPLIVSRHCRYSLSMSIFVVGSRRKARHRKGARSNSRCSPLALLGLLAARCSRLVTRRRRSHKKRSFARAPRVFCCWPSAKGDAAANLACARAPARFTLPRLLSTVSGGQKMLRKKAAAKQMQSSLSYLVFCWQYRCVARGRVRAHAARCAARKFLSARAACKRCRYIS